MLNEFVKYLKYTVIAGAVAFAFLQKDQLHNTYLRYEVGDSVVQVLHPTKFGGGTGFAVEGASGTDYIATNSHVCEVAVDGWVRIQKDGEESYNRKVVYQDNKHDLCLIEGDRRLAPLELASAPKKGDIHYVVGHPGLRQLTVSKGEFIGMDTIQLLVKAETREDCTGEVIELNDMEKYFYNMEFACVKSFYSYASTAVIYGGNSGSPVVNKYGNIIGVAFAGNSSQAHDNYLVPVYELERVLNKF